LSSLAGGEFELKYAEQRSVRRPLVIYSLLQTFRLLYESLPRSEFGRWDEATRAWADALESDLGGLSFAAANISPARGAIAAQAAWTALALFVAGKVFIRDAWTDLASDTFGRITKAQQPSGAFITPDAEMNPEMAWFDELSILHAAASYAVQAEDRAVAAAVAKNSDFISREIQPDHATHQPWGLFAFVWNPGTRPLADQLLHTMRIAEPEKASGISLLLLADALYCIRLFL
jgi:hypothetical protein